MPQGEKFTPKSEEEIRSQVISDYELDADDEANQSFIEKAVKKEIEHQNKLIESEKKLSKAIEQKAKYREEAKKLATLEETPPNGEPSPTGEAPRGESNPSPIDTSNFVTKEELHRQKYPNLSDEDYNSINAIAKANGKSFEDTIVNNSIAKTYFETAEAKQRLDGATIPPSNRGSNSQSKSEDEKVADELDSDLPTGFTSKKA